MYSTLPPEINEEPMTPNEKLEYQISCHLDEENYYLNGFLDIDDERCSELIICENLNR